MTDTTPETVERLARVICAETCAFYGDPPCWRVSSEWPAESCDEPGCMALAQAVASETEDALRALAAENAALAAERDSLKAALDLAGEHVLDKLLAENERLRGLAVTSVDKLHQLKVDFNFTRIVMDDEARKVAGDIVEDISRFVSAARTALKGEDG